MKYLIYLLTIIFLTALMFGFFALLPLHGAVPNLLLLLILFFAITDNGLDFGFIALVSGIWLDLALGLSVGHFAVAFLIIGFASHVIFGKIIFYEQNWKYIPLLVIVATGAMYALVLLNNRLWLHVYGVKVIVSGAQLWTQLLPVVLYTLLMSYPMYWLVGEIKHLVEKLETRKHRV